MPMTHGVRLTQEVMDRICLRIADGESLRAICRDPDMPSAVIVFKHLAQNDEWAKQYARAREASADADAEDIADIATRVLSGEYEPQAARVAIDAKKWAAGKKKPKVYGDRLDMNHSGSFSVTLESDVSRL